MTHEIVSYRSENLVTWMQVFRNAQAFFQMDDICRIVDRAVDIADMVKFYEPERFEYALASLLELAAELRSRAPEHSALDRLLRYIENQRG